MAKKAARKKTTKRAAAAAAKSDGITPREYAARRDRVLKALDGAVAIVFSGSGGAPLLGSWRAHSHFEYLTGIADEAGAAILLDPKAEDPKRRAILFLESADPEFEVWDGYRERIGTAMRERYGFGTIMRNRSFHTIATRAVRKAKKLACLHPPAMPEAPVSPDLALYRKFAERIVGVSIEDRSTLLPNLRSVKSAAELRLMQQAIDASAAGYEAALATIKPGASERQVHRALTRAFEDAGGDGVGYNPIVGAGLNSTVLHYNKNREPIAEGDLVLIDAGASYKGYCADITRTYPANGKFTKRQREVYDIVLQAQLASIRAVKPGASMADVDRAARNVIEKAGFADAFMHGIGHQLGMEVHDAEPDTKLKAGMVVTIEPGVYLPDEKIGVRIEDDILVTAKGNQNLSKAIAKDPAAIERLMKR